MSQKLWMYQGHRREVTYKYRAFTFKFPQCLKLSVPSKAMTILSDCLLSTEPMGSVGHSMNLLQLLPGSLHWALLGQTLWESGKGG